MMRLAHLAVCEQVQHWDDCGHLINKNDVILPPSPARAVRCVKKEEKASVSTGWQAMLYVLCGILDCSNNLANIGLVERQQVQQTWSSSPAWPAPPGHPRDVDRYNNTAHICAHRLEAAADAARKPAAAHSD